MKAIENRIEENLLDTDQNPITFFSSKTFLTEKTIYELNKIKEIEQKINRNDLIFKTGGTKKV